MRLRSLVTSMLLSSALLGGATSALADGQTDLYFQEAVQRYFDLPQNARTFGMAGSSVATSVDSSSVVGNPAGLGMMRGGEFSGTYSYNTISGNEFPNYGAQVDDHQHIGSALLAVPVVPTLDGLPEWGNIGLGWVGYHGTWDDDTVGGEENGSRVVGAYSKAINDSLSLGYSLAYTADRFSQESPEFSYPMNRGFRHTLGILSQLSDMVSLGATTYVGHGTHKLLLPGSNNNEKSKLLEVGTEIGTAVKVLPTTLLTFSVDYTHYTSDGRVESGDPAMWVGGDENGNAGNIRAGVEQAITDWFVVRGGYRYAANFEYDFSREELNELNGSAKYNAWTLGAGLVLPLNTPYIKAVKLDYGVEYRSVGYQDWQHVITASVPFDLCA